MLTKDLIRARIQSGSLKPQFIDTDNPRLLDLAAQLLSLYDPEDSPTRGDIDEAVTPIVNAWSDVRLAKGFNKLLQDRSDFSQPLDLDYAALRRELFLASAALLKQGTLEVEAYGEAARTKANVPADFLEEGIYADLPDNEELTRFRELTDRQLLERYNVGLVQALLLRAESLELVVEAPEPARLRRLFKYLKFFRLLARIYREKKDRLRIVVDGPASLLQSSKKYGLQLASFFPAVCALENWKLQAEVEWKNKQRPLRLSNKDNLVCHYRNFSAYVPEEIRLFHRHFKETVDGWEIVGSSDFLDAGDQELIFPDLSFADEAGRVIHLELFHRWHAGQLEKRLAWTDDQHEDLPLIIGVDTSLSRKPEIERLLTNSAWFERRGFTFRDYPPVSKVQRCLEAVGPDQPGQ